VVKCNLTKRPHCRRRWRVQSYSPGCANVPSHEGTLAPPGVYSWTCASFGPPESTTQIDLFSRFCTAHGRKSLYFTMGGPGPIYSMIPLAYPSQQPKRHLSQLTRFGTDGHRVSIYCTMGR